MKKLILMSFVISALVACGDRTSKEGNSSEEKSIPGAVDKGVSFSMPEDGAAVSSPFIVKMEVSGMEVEPAGMVNDGKGHHHLIVDGSFIVKGQVVPANETHIHYGQGQTEAELELEPGKHTLTLQFADGVHVSYGEEWSKTIEIHVED